jgi:hypothetical protein
MLKNRTIAIAILSALLALSQVDAARAATPLATIRVTAKPMNPPQITQPPGDFDRAFIAQQTGEALIQQIQTGNRDRGRGTFTRTGSTRAGHRE